MLQLWSYYADVYTMLLYTMLLWRNIFTTMPATMLIRCAWTCSNNLCHATLPALPPPQQTPRTHISWEPTGHHVICLRKPSNNPQPPKQNQNQNHNKSRRHNNTCRAVPADAVSVFFGTMQSRAASHPAISTILPLNHTHSYTGGDLYNSRISMIYVCVPSHLSLNK